MAGYLGHSFRWPTSNLKLKKKVLVIGGDSRIATSLIKELTARGDQVIYTSRRNEGLGSLFLDLNYVENFLESNPPDADIVVICAAITKFEVCRIDPQAAYQINVSAPLKIAVYYSGRGARIVFLSTSAVFDGKTPFAHPASLPNSKNEYGKLKAEAERLLTSLDKNIAILRFSKIIVPSENIFSLWSATLEKGETVSAFTDQYISPLTLHDALNVLLAVINDTEDGIYQFSANGDISYYEIISQLVYKSGGRTDLVLKDKAEKKGIPMKEIFRYNSLESSRVEKLLGSPSPAPLAFLTDFSSRSK